MRRQPIAQDAVATPPAPKPAKTRRTQAATKAAASKATAAAEAAPRQPARTRLAAFIRNNGLSLALAAIFLLLLVGHSIAGHLNYNQEQVDHGEQPISYTQYLATGSFVESVGENWESEFLQMYAYVLLTVFLVQKGSAESKHPEEEETVDRAPDPNAPGAPWPVRKGGLWLKLYQHSLSLAFLLLFVFSFVLHLLGGAAEYNAEQAAHGQAAIPWVGYLLTSRFWFESLQNWQSEFLAIGAMVVLTIFLRQRGSPESKPVDSPHEETGH